MVLDRDELTRSITLSITSIKTALQRKRRLSTDAMCLKDKLAHMEKIKALNTKLNRARTNIFDAEDAIVCLLDGDSKAFERFIDLYPVTARLLKNSKVVSHA